MKNKSKLFIVIIFKKKQGVMRNITPLFISIYKHFANYLLFKNSITFSAILTPSAADEVIPPA